MNPIPVIWNANAGAKKRGPIASPPGPEQLMQILGAAGIEAQVIPTESEEDARAAVARAVEAGARLIVAAGGDGTVGLVGKELLGTDVALGVLPMGSVMNIGRMLHVPRDLAAAAEVLAQRREEIIDVGEANGQIFFETATVGLNAAVFRAAQHFEDGDWGSPFRVIFEAFRYRPAAMDLSLDDEQRVTTRALMVTVSNAPYTGVGMTVAPDARLDDGKFDVRVFRSFSKWELSRHMLSIAFGRRRYSPKVTTYRAAHVTVVGRRPLPCRADANDLGTTPLDCRVLPRKLRVVVGPDYDGGRAPG